MANDVSDIRIFLSYSWKNKEQADEIDNHFESIGIKFTRDIRDIKYKDSIKEFMEKVRDANFAVMLISDYFLKSEACMNEVLELLKEKDFNKKFLQVIMPQTDIFSPSGRIQYIKYWTEKKEQLVKELEGLPINYVGEEAKTLQHYENICGSIGQVLTHLKDHNSISYTELQQQRYAPIIEFLGIKEKQIIKEILEAITNSDESEKEFKLEMLLRKYPNSKEILSALGYSVRDKQKAIWYSSKALEIDPKYSLACQNRGLAKSMIEDYEGAIEDFTSAIKMYTEHGDELSNALSEDYIKYEAIELMKIIPQVATVFTNRGNAKSALKDIAGALKDFNTAIQIDQKCYNAYKSRGIVKANEKDYEGSIEDFDIAIEFDEKDADVYLERGTSKSENGDYEGAIKDFDTAIQINPNLAMAFNNRGNAIACLKKHKEAIEDFNIAIQLDSRFSKAYYNRGLAKLSLKYDDGALEDYSIAIDLDPKYKIAYFKRAEIRSVLEDNQGAIEDYTKAIEIDSNFVEAISKRGNVKYAMGDIEGAMQDYGKAIEIDQKFVDPLLNRAIVKADIGDPKGAIKDCTTAILINPKDSELFLFRGDIKGSLGDQQGSIEDYTTALEIDPKFTNAFYNRGISKLELGDRQGAIQDFIAANRLDPNLVVPDNLV